MSVASLPAEPSLAVCSASFELKQHKTSCQHSTDCMAQEQLVTVKTQSRTLVKVSLKYRIQPRIDELSVKLTW